MSDEHKMDCVGCGRSIKSHRIPYGTAWLCVCGRWVVVFSVNREAAIFQTGNEELALEYIAKIAEMLEMK